MKRTVLTALLIIALLITQSTIVQAGIFKIQEKEGNWKTVEDTFVESSYEKGEAYVVLVANDYKLGGWFGSININLKTESGNNITGYIKIYIEELGIEITYYESYIPGTMGFGDKISNKLIIKVGNDTKTYTDYKESPYDSRLNTRLYFSILNVNGTVYVLVQDPYGASGYGPLKIYYENNVSYTGIPVNLNIKVYKNSGDESGSIECSLFLNDVEDGKVYDKPFVKNIDYGLNDLFYVSLDFLIIAIAFNLIASRIRRIKEETGIQVKKSGKAK
jgi:hypothetical protein